MTDKQTQNKEPDSFTPNAPDKYVNWNTKVIFVGCGVITALYIIGVFVGIWLGYGWISLLLPFIPFVIVGLSSYIWEMLRKLYELGYDKQHKDIKEDKPMTRR